jgi:hypothetical protein
MLSGAFLEAKHDDDNDDDDDSNNFI